MYGAAAVGGIIDAGDEVLTGCTDAGELAASKPEDLTTWIGRAAADSALRSLICSLTLSVFGTELALDSRSMAS